jgi:hypothetical protein
LSLHNPDDFSPPGQLLEIANEIYGLDLKVKIIEAENDIKGGTAGPIDMAAGFKNVVVKYRLDFDNSEYVMTPKLIAKDTNNHLTFLKCNSLFAPTTPSQNSSRKPFGRWQSKLTYKLIPRS